MPDELKPVDEVEVLFLDSGYFMSMASALSRSFRKVWYYTPEDTEFKDVGKCVLGDGVEGIERLDDWEKPSNLTTIDLVIVPDLGFAPKAHLLKSMGKAVWASFDATYMEMSRTSFLKWVAKMGLPIVPYKVCVGLTELWEHLKTVERKWVKINKYREQQETFFHLNATYSRPILEGLAVKFGGLSEKPVFVVQDEIETDDDGEVVGEIGYDGWSIDGEFPALSFSGHEKKNEGYIGSLLQYEELHEAVRRVNEAIAPYLKRWGYRNFMSTEVRLKKMATGEMVPFFIDPTFRCAGLTMEHQQENCTNLAQCIWEGANGNMIVPEFKHKIAMEATMHCAHDADGWKVVKNPKHPMVKFDHYAEDDGYCHFPARKSDEVGVVIGTGDTVQEAFDNMKENFETMEDSPVSISVEGFADLFDDIKRAEAAGIHFSDDPLPGPEILAEQPD